MGYSVLGISLLVVCFILFSKNIFIRYYEEKNFKMKESLGLMLKLTMIAPIIVLLVITVLTLTYFKTKFSIRVSHAWLVMSFWICDVVFYYIFVALVRTRKKLIILPGIGMLVATYVAIYITPLNHYENVFQNMSIIIPNLFGLLMLITAYFVDYTVLKNDKK